MLHRTAFVLCEGSNGLIKQGAAVVTEAADVVTVLGPILGESAPASAREPDEVPVPTPLSDPVAEERARITQLLGPTPVGMDDLVRLSGSSPAMVRTVLLELEIAGRLERHGGGLVSLL